MGDDYEVIPSPCPNCKKVSDMAYGPNSDDPPTPGDVSICLYCQSISVFDEDLILREPTEEEILEMPLDEISHLQRKLKEAKIV